MAYNFLNNTTIETNQEIQLDHIHSPQKTKPTMANSIVLTSGTPAWTVGALVEIFATNEVTSPFDIHFVGVGATSAVGAVYEIEFFSGEIGAEVEIGQCRVYRAANQSGSAPTPMMTPKLPAGTRVSARCATGSAGVETIGIAVFYHTY